MNDHKLHASSVEFSEIGRKNLDACVAIQKGFLDAVGTLNQDWAARANAELALASELAAKLTAAKSVPEAAAAYQDWMLKRTSMLVEDSRRLLLNGQKVLNAGNQDAS
jgi:hypothetical protein